MIRVGLGVLLLTIAAGANKFGLERQGPAGLPLPAPLPKDGKDGRGWRDWFRAHHHEWYRLSTVLPERLRPKDESGKEKEASGKDRPAKWRAALASRLEPVLVEMVGKAKDRERMIALLGLGRLRRTDQIPLLKKHADKEVAALLALVMMREPQLHDTFVAWASEKKRDPALRMTALLGVGASGGSQAGAWLARFLDRKDKGARGLLPNTRGKKREFRIAALAGIALTVFPDPDGTPKPAAAAGFAELCARVWQDKRLHEDVRAYALDWLGRIGGAAGPGKDIAGVGAHVPAILKALQRDKSDQIRRSAALALGHLAPKGDIEVAKKIAATIGKERDKPTRQFAALALGRMGGAEATKRLERMVGRAKKEDLGFFYLALGMTRHREARPVLEKFVRTAADENDATAAAIGLLLHGADSGTEALRERFREARTKFLWSNLALILALRRDAKTAAILEKTKKAPPMASILPALALLRPQETLPKLTATLSAPKDEWERLFAPLILSAFGSKQAGLALERHRTATAKDKRVERRIYALVALIDVADGPMLMPFEQLRRDRNHYIRHYALDLLSQGHHLQDWR